MSTQSVNLKVSNKKLNPQKLYGKIKTYKNKFIAIGNNSIKNITIKKNYKNTKMNKFVDFLMNSVKIFRWMKRKLIGLL